MKKMFLALIFISLLFAAHPVSAHPADLYLHRITADISKDGLQIEWNIIPGPLLAQVVWYEADQDQDETVTDEEARAWIGPHLSELQISINDQPVKLELQSFTWPSSAEAISAGSESIVLKINANWNQPLSNENQIVIQNNFKSISSLSFYTISANEGLGLQDTTQDNNDLNFLLTTKPNDKSTPSWETGKPSIPFVIQAIGLNDVAQQAADQSQTQTGYGAYLEGLVRSKESSPSFFFIALIIALITGSLHALTPGHGKTIVAAYLIGSRGTLKHAVFLGSIVTLTHTGSVFLIGILALVASHYIFPTSLFPILEILSGLLIIALGFSLLMQRIRDWRRNRSPHSHPEAASPPQGDSHQHNHPHHDHNHFHEHHHDEHDHTHDIPDPEDVTWRSLLTLGISGGLVPCPEAIAILLLAININRILLGLSLIIAFSVGLAFILIAIGIVMVQSKRLFSRLGFIDRWAYVIPIVSALVVLGLGIGLTVTAVVKAQGSLNQVQAPNNEAGQIKQSHDRVLYMNEDANRRQQVFIKNQGDVTQVTHEDNGVRDASVSLDGKLIAYSASNKDGSTSLWLIDSGTLKSKQLLHCAVSVCSQVTWSRDPKRVMYARADFTEQTLGLPSVWWLDIESDETAPVFDSGLPVYSFNWSPDSQWLTYTSVITPSVEAYNLTSNEKVSIPTQTGGQVTWSPTVDAFIFADARVLGNRILRTLVMYNTKNGETSEPFAGQSYDDYDPSWSPDGKWIAFIRHDATGEQIWLMRADGSEPRQLTNDKDTLHGKPLFAADGKSLLYSYSVKSLIDSEVRILNIDTGAVTEVGKGNFPLWLP